MSASGDASNRLIASGAVAPIEPSSIPAIKPTSCPTLQAPAHNTVDGVHYGVPYMYGPNFLMYNTDVVKPAPTSWDVAFEKTIDAQPNPYAGKITAYDSPIYIADAALYLKAHQPDLGITDPYELTQPQLDAAVTLLKAQAPMIGKYWVAVHGRDRRVRDRATWSPARHGHQPVEHPRADKPVPVAAVIPLRVSPAGPTPG